MDDQEFIKKLKQIIDIFSSENFEFAIKISDEMENMLSDPEEKRFIKNIKNVIYATYLINKQEIDEALKLLESSYLELKNFRPNYKGLKVENLIQSINQSIADIKTIIKNEKK
ncbi:MAG: hypothetical protein N2169_01710 [bacterium]|nr:hypothetical protein [bacterium]